MSLSRLVLVASAAVALAVGTTSSAQAATSYVWNMDEAAGSTTMTGSPGPNGKVGKLVKTGVSTDTGRGYSFPGGNPLPPQPDPNKIATVAHTTALNPGTGRFSVTLRFKTSNTQNGNLVQKGQAGTAGGYFKVELKGGRVYCLWRDGTWKSASTTPAANLSMYQTAPANRWNTLTCARTTTSSGAKITTMTLNGVTTRANRWVGKIANTWPLAVGGKSYCSTSPKVECDYYQGLFDSLKITSG